MGAHSYKEGEERGGVREEFGWIDRYMKYYRHDALTGCVEADRQKRKNDNRP